jgi:hypothetical protein
MNFKPLPLPAMKTFLYHPLGFAALLLAPVVLTAQDREMDTNRAPASNALKEGERANIASQKVGINQAISDLLHNPDGLFTRLDTDNNGQLSPEEFRRMTSVGSTGTAANTGTTGITGATGATGVSGQTMQTGIGGDPATAPATTSTGAPATEGETTAPTNPTKPNLPKVPANPGLPTKPGQPEAPAAPNNPSNAQPPGTPAPPPQGDQ